MSSLNEDLELLLGPLPEPNIIVPSEINKHLKPCQQSVVRFLYTHYTQRDGGILCDNNELHDILPVAVFISSLIYRKTDTIEKFLLIINEDEKARLSMWLTFLTHVGIDSQQIKYCGKNTSSYVSTEGNEPCFYIFRSKRLVHHLSYLKKTQWAMLVYDNCVKKSSLTTILNYSKDWTCDCRFIISHDSVFHSKKYFWSLFKFINKSSVLGKTWQEFDDTGYQYYFNKVDRTLDGKMSKIDIYKSLEATRIRFEYVSRNITCTEDLHKNEPWVDKPTSGVL